MKINLELPQELEEELAIEAEQINLSLSEYILRLLTVRPVLNTLPTTGAELVDYWQQAGLINSRPEINDSQEYARQIRNTAEYRQM